MTASDDIFFFYIFCRQSSMRLNVIYHIFVYFSTYYLYLYLFLYFMHNICHFKTCCMLKDRYRHLLTTHDNKKKCLCHYTNISLFHPSFIFPESYSPRSLYDFFMKSESPVKTSCLLPSFPVLLKVCGSYSYNDPTIPCRFLLSSCFCMLPAVLYVLDTAV